MRVWFCGVLVLGCLTGWQNPPGVEEGLENARSISVETRGCNTCEVRLKIEWDDSCDGGIRHQIETLDAWLTQ